MSATKPNDTASAGETPLAIDTTAVELNHEPVENWQEVGPGVTTGFAELGTIAGIDYGLWEMSGGQMRDIEGEEVFLVISGAGEITFRDSDREPIVMRPGTLVRLDDGISTLWTITEAPLRKLFIAPSAE